jgi:DNA polymerase-3 subunit epsilon
VAASASAGALAKHRILVLGGTHEQGAAVRERIAEAGGQAAANLTTSITDVVLLADHDRDQRWPRVSALELPRLDPATLHPVAEDHVPSAEVHQPTEIPDPIVLPPGGVTDLALDVQEWSLSIAWPDRPAPIEVDVAAFVVDQDEQVGTDEDFCFYNQTAHPTQALELDLDIPNEAVATIRPEFLPADRQRIVLAAAIDGDQTFGDVGPIELVLRTGDGNPAVRATLDAATGERSLLLANFYHRNGVWRLRAVGQGYQANLAGLAVMHGVDIEES